MAAITMPCPATGATVLTGQHVSVSQREDVLAAGGRFRCSSCGEIHPWTKADVAVREGVGIPQPRA